MGNTILKTDFDFPGQTKVYHGKVREVYTINNDLLVMIVSDRIYNTPTGTFTITSTSSYTHTVDTYDQNLVLINILIGKLI